MRSSFRFAAAALVVAAVAACSSRPTISNTGYQGTWSRIGSGDSRSVVALVVNGADAWFRWSLRSPDGKWIVRCEWSGKCEEFVQGNRVAEYQFRSWIDQATGKIFVQEHRKIFRPKEIEASRTDQLVVSEDGKTLTVFTVERDGQSFEPGQGPTYAFQKSADIVADPPKGSGGTGGGRP